MELNKRKDAYYATLEEQQLKNETEKAIDIKREEWKRSLAAYLLNEHSCWTDRSRVLIRAVSHELRY